jgi:hypothetical protein
VTVPLKPEVSFFIKLGSNSELSEAEDAQLNDVLDQDFNWDLEIAKRKKRWKAKEEELRAEAKSQKPPDSEENLSLEVRPTWGRVADPHSFTCYLSR